MAVQRGIAPIIFSIIGIVIVVVAVIVIINVMSGEPPVNELIAKSIELRKAQDSIQRAELISSVDDLVIETENAEIADQWDRMTKCLAAGCPDEAYLDMVLVAVSNYEDDVQNSALVVNVIATAKYWGDPEHLLDFSKALSMANEQIDLLDDRKAQKAWESVVACNGACPEKNDLYFDVIGNIVR